MRTPSGGRDDRLVRRVRVRDRGVQSLRPRRAEERDRLPVCGVERQGAGFVSYGVHSGTRAVEHLRLALAEVKVADVRTQVALSLFTDFEITDPTEPGVFSPGEHQEPTLTTMLDEVITWSRALNPLRDTTASTGSQAVPA